MVSAGQYGANLNRLQFEFAPGVDGDLVNIRQTVLQLKDYAPDQATQDIVDDAVEFAETAGNVVLGEIEDPFQRARRVGDDGQTVENRGGESTLGNLIAEMQRWKTEADIGFMNPGGLRADLLGILGTPRDVTYRQAANTQPFANTLVTMDLTGAKIKELLEQQWQRDADGNIPSRPFLRLGTSDRLHLDVRRVEARGQQDHRHVARRHADRPGRDVQGLGHVVPGRRRRQLLGVRRWHQRAGHRQDRPAGCRRLPRRTSPLTVPTPAAGGVRPAPGGRQGSSAAPAPYVAGDAVTLDVSSLAMSGVDDVQDTQVELFYGATSLGTAPVTNTMTTDLTDAIGTATLSFNVPAGVGDGTTLFRLEGNLSGTEINVPVQTSDGLVNSTVSGTDQSIVFGEAGSVPVTVTPATANGSVTLKDGADLIGTLTLDGSTGMGNIAVPANSLPVGVHTLALEYSGDGTNGSATGTVTVTVLKATPSISAIPTPATVEVGGETSSIAVTVSSDAAGDPTGSVTATVGAIVVDTQPLSGGTATLTVGPFDTAGDKSVTISYLGDADNTPVTTSVTVGVDEATASVTAGTPNPASVPINSGQSNIRRSP